MIAADANDPRGIVWIASYPKSGNTWIRLFLHHLLLARRGQAPEAREIDRIATTTPGINRQVAFFEKAMGKPLAAADMRDIVLARPAVQEEMVRTAPPGVLPVKTHAFLGRVFDTPLISLGVSVGAVYVVRNPLDVVLSLAPYLSLSLDDTIRVMATTLTAPPKTAELVPEIWGSWSENVLSWTTDPPPVVRIVRYEDLLADPLAGLGGIAGHMRIGAGPEEVARAVELSAFERVARIEAEGGFSERPANTTRFFRAGTAGQWRDVLTAAQVDLIVKAHGEQMARFGYLPA